MNRRGKILKISFTIRYPLLEARAFPITLDLWGMKQLGDRPENLPASAAARQGLVRWAGENWTVALRLNCTLRSRFLRAFCHRLFVEG